MNTPNLTKNQALVLDVLSRAEQPMSAYTILDKLRDNGFRAPLQVYRALEKLLDFGLVHRLESLNSFVACSHTHESCCQHLREMRPGERIPRSRDR
jgi:Fur family transcriptional regulator, zinc uptake regulator